MVLYVHRNRTVYHRRGRGDGRPGRDKLQLLRALRPVKTEVTVSYRQNNDVKEVGTPPV